MADTQTPTPQAPHEGLNYQQDIHNTDIRDIMTEWNDGEWEDGQAPAPKKPEEAQPITPVVEEKPEPQEPVVPVETQQPVTPEPAKPVVDEEKLTDDVVSKLYDKLSPQTPEEKKDFTARLKELNDKAHAENREPTYEEALALLGTEVKESTKEDLRKELKKEILDDLNKEAEAQEKKAAETKKEQEETVKKNNQVLKEEWDRQLGILVSQGSIPKVVDAKDTNDPGMVAQKNLFEALNVYAKEQQAAGKKVSLNLVEAFMSPHYKNLTTQPGKDAPVNGARKSVSGDSPTSLNYLHDVHNADLRDILAEVYEASEAQ